MSISQLNELLMEMENIIRELSETLISELALRDEYEYEKEMKNSFISLLLAVQNRRRQFHIEKKKGKAAAQGRQPASGECLSQIKLHWKSTKEGACGLWYWIRFSARVELVTAYFN